MHYNGAKSAAIALQQQCKEQQLEIQRLKAQLGEPLSCNTFQIPGFTGTHIRGSGPTVPSSGRPQRIPLKRALDSAGIRLDSRRIRPFPHKPSRIEELEDSPPSRADHQTSYHFQTGQDRMAPYSTAWTSSSTIDEDVAYSPAFSTPRIRSDISPRRKAVISSHKLASFGTGDDRFGSRTSAQRRPTGPIAHPTFVPRVNGMYKSRFKAIRAE